MGVRVRLTKNSSAYFPFWLAIPVALVWWTVFAVAMLVFCILYLVPREIIRAIKKS